MAYRPDPDLEFLGNCKSEELADLVQLLTYDPKDDKKRLTESLTSNGKYKRYYPDHSKYWKAIAEEIQCYGGNSIVNLVRRKGVLYKEILCDVCDKMKVKYKKTDSTKIIEITLFEKVITKEISELSENELKKIAKGLDIQVDNIPAGAIAPAVVGGLHLLLSTSVPVATNIIVDIFGAVIARQVVNSSIGALIGGTLAGRALGVAAGPIGWAISGGWLLADIASPATRVTIPAVLQIIYLRSLYEQRTQEVQIS
ncbi:Uncharacterized protein conserved in bacteria [Canicola haemoglobinophilus]|uniref:Uncharacterized protein conserved in bacteria n=1 Tax=Canicola haemoglobinophilus TaxID=733 RepID=A0AB38HAA5_9PAST|nr:DUF3944 domain-containing protein [Canicola haemoglobinophilus]STO54100.1 Uncharacterized protein conserved in bacteria [Canicola haemoglobinophilus]STO68633.1 Uncharacterized protein conserved in bacteria [Canicola haemoglobinophilus]